VLDAWSVIVSRSGYTSGASRFRQCGPGFLPLHAQFFQWGEVTKSERKLEAPLSQQKSIGNKH